MMNITNKDYLLDSILEYCDDLITIKNLDLEYVACNKAFLEHTGANCEAQIINKTIFDIFPPESADIIAQNINQVIKDLTPKTYIFQVTTNNSRKIVKQTSTPILRDGKIEGVLSISSDVTNEENLKSKLYEKVYQFNALLDNLPMFVYMKNKDGQYIFGSKHSKEFVEKGLDRFAENICINKINDTTETESEDNYVIKNKKTLIQERMATDTNNKPHWYKIHKAPILTENNDITGIVTITENIDQEKIIENRKNLFIATLSHDLKNPLLAQISSLELFYNGTFGELTPSQKEMLEMILESSKYMRDMLYTLLKTWKDNNGIIKLEMSEFNINSLIKKNIKEITDFANNKKLKINLKSKLKSKHKIFADETQIRRVFGNLLNNAINYAFPHTSINIELYEKNHQTFISFENRSSIISEDLKKHIFDKYVCGNKLHDSVGVGLGLYFCQKVINAHEGSITLKSNGNINKFIVQIPQLNKNSTIISEIVL